MVKAEIELLGLCVCEYVSEGVCVCFYVIVGTKNSFPSPKRERLQVVMKLQLLFK